MPKGYSAADPHSGSLFSCRQVAVEMAPLDTLGRVARPRHLEEVQREQDCRLDELRRQRGAIGRVPPNLELRVGHHPAYRGRPRGEDAICEHQVFWGFCVSAGLQEVLGADREGGCGVLSAH